MQTTPTFRVDPGRSEFLQARVQDFVLTGVPPQGNLALPEPSQTLEGLDERF
jgi:hypothetical protein